MDLLEVMCQEAFKRDGCDNDHYYLTSSMPKDSTSTHKSDKRSRKRHKEHDGDEPSTSHSHKKKRSKKAQDSEHTVKITDDDVQNDDEWVEKNIDLDGERVSDIQSLYYTR